MAKILFFYVFQLVGVYGWELASLLLDYSIDDNWSIIGQFIYTWAASTSTAAIFDRDVRLGLSITYSF